MKDCLFTSESVSEGHPDKMADQISDAILDAFLTQDRLSRVACEVMLTKDLIIIGGEFTSKETIDIQKQARSVVRHIGYDDIKKGFDYKSCSILDAMHAQSKDISAGVGHGKSQGAGDQGMVFGYAVDETKEYMPLSIDLCHKMMKALSQLRRTNTWAKKHIWPDSKSQVTVQYENGRVVHIPSLVVSTQHAPNVTIKQLKEFLTEEVIDKVLPRSLTKKPQKIFINPTGRFVVGGPCGDCGLTGRKIIVDTYGGHGAHGGGGFSGKDPSKVDRSAAYATRHIAKNIVAAGLAKKCLVQVAYAIGVAQPVSFMIEDYGTLTVSKNKLLDIVKKLWDLSPAGIIAEYDLLKPIYLATASYGHFGRKEKHFKWEQLDKVSALQDAFSKTHTPQKRRHFA